MKRPRYLLYDKNSEWHLVDVDSPVQNHCLNLNIAEDASRVVSAIRNLLGAPQQADVFLGLSAQQCYSSEIELPNRRGGFSNSEKLYALEASLPVSGEELVADFLSIGGHTCLGVAVEFERVRPLLEELEHHSLPVQGISPLALLALQSIKVQLADTTNNVILWQYDQSVEGFLFRNAKLCEWKHLEATREAISRQLTFWNYRHGDATGTLCCNLNPMLLEEAKTVFDRASLSLEQADLVESACEAVGQVLAGKTDPWIDLCRGPLSSEQKKTSWNRPLRFALASMIAFLALLAATLYQKNDACRQSALQTDFYLKELFRNTLPDQRVPVGIKSRLRAELSTLSRVTGNASIPKLNSALPVVADILHALPSNTRLRIVELRIEEDGQVHIAGEVRNHGDVDSLASSIRRAGFQVDQPQSQALNTGGVSFRLNLVGVNSKADTRRG